MSFIADISELRDVIAGLENHLQNQEDFLREVAGPLLREIVGENLKSGGKPPFAPLSLTTAALRGNPDPLVGGKLERSYTEKDAPGHIEEVFGGELIFGSEYGGLHETGGTARYSIAGANKKAVRFLALVDGVLTWIIRRRVNHPPLPARPVLNLTPETEERLANAAEEYFAHV